MSCCTWPALCTPPLHLLVPLRPWRLPGGGALGREDLAGNPLGDALQMQGYIDFTCKFEGKTQQLESSHKLSETFQDIYNAGVDALMSDPVCWASAMKHYFTVPAKLHH